MKPQKKFVSCIDVCLPDYFAGYHKPVFQVAIYKDKYTCGEIADELEAESAVIDEMYQTHEDYKEDIECLDAYIVELRDKKDEIFYLDPNFAETDEYEYSIYMYFAVIQPVVRNGLTFLNP